MSPKACSKNGFTLIESVIAVAIFALIAISVFQGFTGMMQAVKYARLKTTATALANEQFEIARNLSYADVGIVDGIPPGKIPSTQNIVRDGTEFEVKTVVRNIDDSFDGTIAGDPGDLSPSDYKLAELEISCDSCRDFEPLTFTTYIGPRGLESASTNGALFVKVFDASGQPIQSADVHIENNQEFPAIVIDDTTNKDGLLQIVDAPPGVEAYEITVSKFGYSTDQTYESGALENPNPIKPHSTVALQTLTKLSFSIDKVSDLDVSSVLSNCSSTPSVDFSLSGSKLIGTNPDVLKYEEFLSTNSSGQELVSNLEWDTYDLTLTDALFDLAGTIPSLPLILNPDSDQDFKIVVTPKNPNSLLVTVKDASTGLPISDASVFVSGSSYNQTLVTGRGFLTQTDWSGGSGQDSFSDPTRYAESDGNIEINNPSGEIRLKEVFDEYEISGHLISSTFDTGSQGNFHQILWQPQNQPPQTGGNSVKFQVATNNDAATWNFLGPDGTPNTFYTLNNQNIHSVHDDDRYFRYKVFLETVDASWTPSVSDVSFTFTSACVPPGQVLFDGLSLGNYDLTISKSGFQTVEDSVDLNSSWQQKTITLSP